MDRFYAGIGSRSTPADVLDLMRRAAYELAGRGFVLRTGGAGGADTAFADGAGDGVQLFLPWQGFNSLTSVFEVPLPAAFALAKEHHPAWERCSRGARALHARNCHQVLGPGLDDPCKFVLCWTKDGGPTGGTGQAIRLADACGVPVFNLHDVDVRARLERFCSEA